MKQIYWCFPPLTQQNIALNLMKVSTDALHVGPILLGAALPAHILTQSVTSRGVVNMSAFAVVESQTKNQSQLKIPLTEVKRI